MKKAIAAITTSQPGGELRVTQEIVKHLQNKSHVDFLTIHLPSGSSFRLIREIIHDITESWSFFFTLKKCEGIYSTRLIPITVAAFHPSTKKVRTIFHFHGFSHQNFQELVKHNQSKLYLIPYFALFSILKHIIDSIALDNCKVIVVPTPNSKSQLLTRFPHIDSTKIHIVPNGVDHDIFYPKLNKKKYLLWSGRLSAEKNPKLFEEIAHDLPQYQFHQIVLGQTKKSKLSNVIIKSNLNPQELASEYQQAVLTIITSITEQLPLTYLESSACGTPVITPPLPSILPLQPKNLISSYNKSDFVKKIMRYMSLPYNRKEQISQQYFRLSKMYSWEKTYQMINVLLTHED